MRRTLISTTIATIAVIVSVLFIFGDQETAIVPAVSERPAADPGIPAEAGASDARFDGTLPDGSNPGSFVVEPFARRIRTLPEIWAEEVPLAEAGDAVAALRLFMGIDHCRRMLADAPTADAFADRLRRMAGDLPDWQRRNLDRYLKMHAACLSSDPMWLETGLDWLTQAADAGIVEAQLLWWRRADEYLDLTNADGDTRRWYRDQSDRYIEAARDAGNVWAMQQIIERDALSDPVSAYAHAALAFRVADERVRADDGAGTSVRRQRLLQHQQVSLQTRLGELAGSLSGAQIAEAQARADRLYERCCSP